MALVIEQQPGIGVHLVIHRRAQSQRQDVQALMGADMPMPGIRISLAQRLPQRLGDQLGHRLGRHRLRLADLGH